MQTRTGRLRWKDAPMPLRFIPASKASRRSRGPDLRSDPASARQFSEVVHQSELRRMGRIGTTHEFAVSSGGKNLTVHATTVSKTDLGDDLDRLRARRHGPRSDRDNEEFARDQALRRGKRASEAVHDGLVRNKIRLAEIARQAGARN